MALKLKDFTEYSQEEINEYVETIKKEFEFSDMSARAVLKKIENLLSKNIILGPVEVDLYGIIGSKPTVTYYHIVKMLCKGNPKKLEVLNKVWTPDIIKIFSSTWITEYDAQHGLNK